MVARPGYKQTEVGVIPEDWDVDNLGNISTISSGTTPARELRERYYSNGTVHWVKTMDLNNREIVDTDERVTEVALQETSLKVYDTETVLVAMYGGFNQIGRTGLLKIPAAVNQAISAVRPNNQILDSAFLIDFLNYRVGYWKNVAISSRKDPNITSADIKNFPVVLPPLAEQQAIAEALSDVDGLISALDALIAKQRAIKQGAMQELLTGQRRLPGFAGEWEVNQLENVSALSSGTTPSRELGERYYHNGTINWVKTTDLNNSDIVETSEKITTLAVEETNLRIYDVGTVLVAMYGGFNQIGRTGILKIPAAVNQALTAIRADSKVLNPVFLINYLNFQVGYWKAVAMSSRKDPNITRSDIKTFPIALPSLAEQTAIAQILADMDDAIAALVQKRAKTVALKQGMMQALLTGQVRLV
jgi:type I restriction enzyme S subunit